MNAIKNIPFPAVTVCSEVRSKKEIFSYTDIYHKATFDSSEIQVLTEHEYMKFWIAFRYSQTNFSRWKLFATTLQICEIEDITDTVVAFPEKIMNGTIFDSIKLVGSLEIQCSGAVNARTDITSPAIS